jgi:hypothetical protein
MIMRGLRTFGLFAVGTLVLSGCPNPNTYTTPRTLDPGTLQWQVAPEVIGVTYNATTTDANGHATTQSQTAVAPMVPSFGVRLGLVDGLDLGVRLQNLDSLAADAKIRLLKGTFDLALDPGPQGYYATINGVSAGVVYLHAPVLLGFNIAPNTSLVLSPGLVFSVATASVDNGSGVSGVASSSGVWARLGFGVDFRITRRFAIHPEVTAMREFGNLDGFIFVGGVGFNFGAQPDYSDVGGVK